MESTHGVKQNKATILAILRAGAINPLGWRLKESSRETVWNCAPPQGAGFIRPPKSSYPGSLLKNPIPAGR